eukprot:14066317-Alexandrium_andersonii.AAC.1
MHSACPNSLRSALAPLQPSAICTLVQTKTCAHTPTHDIVSMTGLSALLVLINGGVDGVCHAIHASVFVVAPDMRSTC